MISSFLGHLHPVLLHLPIGVFSISIMLFYFHPDKSFRLSGQLNFMLIISAICAFISAITGWLLGHSGDYQESAVRIHQWTAIVFTLMNALLYGIHWYSLSKNQLHRAFQPLLIITFMLMMYTGHEGGTLTHGEGFLLMDEQWIETVSDPVAGKTNDEPDNKVTNDDKFTTGNLPPVALPDSLVVKKLQQSGFIVKPVSSGSGWLDISAISMSTLQKEQLQMLERIAKNIHGLNLSGHQLSDEDVQGLTIFENLKRLDIRNTGLTDGFLEKVSGLTNLEYFNLVGTNVTDDGLKYLEHMKGLRKVYCWNTKITLSAVNRLHQRRPELDIQTGR